jgi:hypothetical protein
MKGTYERNEVSLDRLKRHDNRVRNGYGLVKPNGAEIDEDPVFISFGQQMKILNFDHDDQVVESLIERFNSIEKPGKQKMDWSIAYFNLTDNFINKLTKRNMNNYSTSIIVGGPEANAFNGSKRPLGKDIPGMYRVLSAKIQRKFMEAGS